MQSLSSAVRRRNLAALASDPVDVLVIGGGVTGAGVALDAAARGYRVALIEKADFASGTSSKSTKLVHGGIRYLPNFDFALVHEGLIERGLLLRNAPHLVHPLGFVLPIYQGDRHPVGMPFTTPGGIGLGAMLDAGLWLYDLLAGKHSIQRHRHLRRQAVMDFLPDLVTEKLRDGFMYYDAQTNDARLTLALLHTAAQQGALLANYAAAMGFIMEGGTVRGAQVRDLHSGDTLAVRARHVVNATGVFAEQVEALTGATPQVRIEPSKGVHLVFSRDDVPLRDAAIVLPETEDRRILFIVPWESRVVFGTTDTGSGDLDHPSATPADVAYLLKYLNRYLTHHLTEEQIITTFAGYRPLVRPRTGSAAMTAKLSRTHAVLQSPSGLVSIVGGKLTTYRRMAQDTVDVLSRRDGRAPAHPTLALTIQGGVGWPQAQGEIARQGAALGLAMPTIAHLGNAYGTDAASVLDLVAAEPALSALLIADLPYIQAEAVFACRYEMALTPGDVLARRTAIALEDRQQGLGCLDQVAALMARELGWSVAEHQAQMVAYAAAAQSQTVAESVR
jgi:glycerol-3-phosphate dehydrogenase